MKKIFRSQSLILKLFTFSILIFAATIVCSAQDKIDLELKVQTTAETGAIPICPLVFNKRV